MPKYHTHDHNKKIGFGIWLIAILIPLLIMAGIVWNEHSAEAAVTSNAVVFFGDTSTTNQGVVRARTLTNPVTWGAQFNAAAASGTTFIPWVVAKTAPTRQEMIIGALHQNGTLDIQTCTTGCDANADFTARWNNPGTSGTQDCDSAPTSGTCTRPFDIGYLAVSGKAFVAYSDNVAAKAYYALWDGSAWSPNTTPGSPGASNELNINPGGGGAACSGTPRWIRIVPAGDNLANTRSDRAFLLVSDSNSDLCAFYWNGSSFDTGTTLTTNLVNDADGQSWDGNWQGNINFLAEYSNSGVNEVRYNKYVVGTGWGSDAQAYTTASSPIWIFSAADPTSSRIMSTNISTGNDWRAAVWRGDNATDGWTSCSTTGCPDTAIESVGANHAASAFERFSGEAISIYNDAGNSAATKSFAYTPSATWSPSGGTAVSITSTDDALKLRLWASPNSDDMVTIVEDVDCKTYSKTWEGSAWNATQTQINTATTSSYGAACPLSTSPGAPPAGAGNSFDLAWKFYSPWQRNWRFYSGSDTTATPTTALAAENTAPTDIAISAGAVRLRINYTELGGWGIGNAASRKKLQYTSGCNPVTSLEESCTWTDVDNSGGAGIWRYKDCNGGTTACDDNQLISASVLTGTNATCTAGNGCGTFILSKDAAAGANMTHNSGIVQESEWSIESNGAAGGTTYYFRIFDVEQDTLIFRQQDLTNCGAGSTQCTYPSLTTVVPGPTTDQVMRGGVWFNGGAKQPHYWAN